MINTTILLSLLSVLVNIIIATFITLIALFIILIMIGFWIVICTKFIETVKGDLE